MEYDGLDILCTDIENKKWRHELSFTKMSYNILLRNVGIIQAASSTQFLHSPHILLKVLLNLWPNAYVKERRPVVKDLFNLSEAYKYWLISKRIKRTNILTKIIQMIECLKIFLKTVKYKSV